MFKKALKIAGGTLLGLFVVAMLAKVYTDNKYFDNYDPKAPYNVQVLETEAVNAENPALGYEITKFTFDGYGGEKVPTLLSLPLKKSKPLPAIVFLHGIGQNKGFLKEITAPFNQTGFAFASMDQFMQGERKLPKGTSGLASLRAFQQRPAKTINETRRLIGYLASRPDIDPQRIYLVGASYGAITGSTVMARDKRIRAGIMVYGGGDLGKLINSTATRLGIAAGFGWIDGKKFNPEKPPLPTLTPTQDKMVGAIIWCATPLVRYFGGAMDPIHYVGRIAPTPVYFQNGKFDVLVPAPAGKALQDAAGEPKKVTWYDSDHVGIDLEKTKIVLRDGLAWLVEQDNPLRAPEDQVKDLPAFDVKNT
jgi:dienelactone hydrolase